MSSDSETENDEPSQSDMLLGKIQEGDLEGLRSSLRQMGANSHFLLNVTHRSNGVEGNMLHFAIYYDQQHIVSFLFDELVRVNGSIATVAEMCEPTFFALHLQKYSMVLLLLAKGCNPNQRRQKEGNTLLHCVCGRKNPPLNFIKQIMKLKLVDPNIQNDDGFTPLHLLAMRAAGVGSRDVAKLLKAKGASLDMLTPDQKTAAMITKNSYIREVLMLNVAGRRRHIPKLNFDDEDRINNMTLEDIHKHPIETPRELKEDRKKRGLLHLEDDKPKHKLSQEEQEEQAERLVGAAMKNRLAKLDALEKKYLTPIERRTLTEEQIQDSNSRLYNESMETKEAKMEELMEKYVNETTQESSVMSEDGMQESVARLYNASIDRHKEVHQKLYDKYVTPPLLETQTKKKGKAELEVGVQQLYYKALEKSKEKQQKAYEHYVPAARLVKTRKLKRAEQQAMADRLCTTKM
eukprot:TRINITY_DN105380_c0_g1_i1.p1 TRINITY_DN105380_c0_g1~~TRINITY_DN105380_c0_g1_i1.p1  ORF type:complete len:463 (+),score=42.14 TRINITY_DN105380_c0_g1_i1:80-1468(+)